VQAAAKRPKKPSAKGGITLFDLVLTKRAPPLPTRHQPPAPTHPQQARTESSTGPTAAATKAAAGAAATAATNGDVRKPRIGFFMKRTKKPKLSVMKKKILMERLQVRDV
jgi:hypothetical protein